MIAATEALEHLRAGNRRFVDGDWAARDRVGPARRSEVAAKQEPIAIVVGCADSRVPPEIVFDQGLGDLFVIRVAGNIIAPSQLESVEFAAQYFGSRLVVVLGHSRCGAVQASLLELDQPATSSPRSLRRVVHNVRPAVDALLADDPECDTETLTEAAVRANVGASVRALKEESSILAGLMADEGLEIVGAEYSLDSGEVDWL